MFSLLVFGSDIYVTWCMYMYGRMSMSACVCLLETETVDNVFSITTLHIETGHLTDAKAHCFGVSG